VPLVAIGKRSHNLQYAFAFNLGFQDIFDAITGKRQPYDPAGISLARARDSQNPYVRPRTILSTLADAAAKQAQAALFRQGTRLNPAPVPQPVPQTFAAVGEQKLEPLVTKGTQTMSLDLGGLLGTLGTSYIEARYGGPRAPQVTAPTIRPQGPRAGVAAQPVLLETLPEMAGDVYDYFFTDEQKQSLSQMPNAKVQVDPRTGRVSVCRNRRRRKRLATTSDIKDLAALKSVLSPADLKTWIATHPS
jgi:hypothetical protein